MSWTALERAVRDRPAVCILDIGLDMDGNALARQLRVHPATKHSLLVP